MKNSSADFLNNWSCCHENYKIDSHVYGNALFMTTANYSNLFRVVIAGTLAPPVDQGMHKCLMRILLLLSEADLSMSLCIHIPLLIVLL